MEGKDVSDDKTASVNDTDESQLCSNIEGVIYNMYYTTLHDLKKQIEQTIQNKPHCNTGPDDLVDTEDYAC